MSFILDALKKSETERQQQGSAEFAKVPTGGRPTRAPAWLLVLGVLLAINLVVLIGLLLKPPSAPQIVAATTAAESSMAPATDSRQPEPQPIAAATDRDPPSFEDRVAQAKQDAPTADAAASSNDVLQETGIEQATPAAGGNLSPVANRAALPTIYEVIADGSIMLPELHLDIHVYSEVPQDRFVFINMSKQREKSQLGEGPIVDEITPDGVILTYRDKSFLLPRD